MSTEYQVQYKAMGNKGSWYSLETSYELETALKTFYDSCKYDQHQDHRIISITEDEIATFTGQEQ